jgi:hypothetical protein
MRDDKDEFGSRMKSYEGVEAKRKLMPQKRDFYSKENCF